MTIEEVHEELRHCLSDWEGFLANKNFIERNRFICWPNYQPTILQHVSWEDVELCATNKQYSFQLHDGSVVQLLYDFRGKSNSVRNATLAYFEAPPQYDDQEDETLEQSGADEFLAGTDTSGPRWIRLDYKDTGNQSCVHADCHLHLAGFPDTRISVNGVPGPRQFVEALFAWFYPDVYSQAKLDADPDDRYKRVIDVNRVCHPITPSIGFHPICFLSLPPSVRHTTLPRAVEVPRKICR